MKMRVLQRRPYISCIHSPANSLVRGRFSVYFDFLFLRQRQQQLAKFIAKATRYTMRLLLNEARTINDCIIFSSRIVAGIACASSFVMNVERFFFFFLRSSFVRRVKQHIVVNHKQKTKRQRGEESGEERELQTENGCVMWTNERQRVREREGWRCRVCIRFGFWATMTMNSIAHCHQSSRSSSCQDKDAMIIIIVMRAAIDGQPFQLPYHAFK